jgi:hypothetical protein
VKAPDWMQGRAFLGKFIAPSNEFLHGFRGRMDERYDLVRSVTDGRYVYIRNYMPHLIYAQHIDFMWQTPTTRVWEKMHQDGKLTPAQDAFWNSKPAEELYDLKNDPDEVTNLAASPDHQQVKARLRKAQQDHALAIRDMGFVPEGERYRRSRPGSAYDLARTTELPLQRIIATAELASMLDGKAVPELIAALKDNEPAVRYWAVLGLLMRGRATVTAAGPGLNALLKDSSPDVRISAAEALGRFGSDADLQRVLPLLVEWGNWKTHDVFTSLAALNSLDALGPRVAPVREQIQRLPSSGLAPEPRYSSYIPRLVEELQARAK